MRRSARTLHACCTTVIPGPYIPPSQAEEPDFAARVYSCRRGWNFRMADQKITTTGIAAHGASRLPSVEIDTFNIELKDDEGIKVDRTSKRAFRDILEKWRKPLRKSREDPFGKEPTENISEEVMADRLFGDDADSGAVVHSAIEDFA